MCVSEHFSFAEIIHPPHRCGISRRWLDRMIIAQMFLRLATIKGHSKMQFFITQHNDTDVSIFRERTIGMLTAGMSTRAVTREFNVNFSTISHLQRRFREFGSTSNWPHNRRPPAQDLHIQHLHLQGHLRPATQTAAATFGLHNQRISAQTVRNHLRDANLHACRPHRGLDLTAVRHRKPTWVGKCSHSMASGTLERSSLSWMNPGFHCAWQMADSVYGVVWVSVLLMSTLWIEWPMGAVGLWYGQAYVMDNEHRCILLMAFWMHRDTVTRSWGLLLCHASTTITSCGSMIMHGPMLQGSVHNSWKLKTSQFLHDQHTHQTCHPLNMFRMLWIGVYDSVFQILPISSNFAQPLKRSGPTFHRPQSTIWSTLCEGDVLHCMRKMVVTPDTDWFSDPPTHTHLDRFVNNIWEK